MGRGNRRANSTGLGFRRKRSENGGRKINSHRNISDRDKRRDVREHDP
jgi:hypothetical protein